MCVRRVGSDMVSMSYILCCSGSDDEDAKTKRKRAKREVKQFAKEKKEARQAVVATVSIILSTSLHQF